MTKVAYNSDGSKTTTIIKYDPDTGKEISSIKPLFQKALQVLDSLGALYTTWKNKIIAPEQGRIF